MRAARSASCCAPTSAFVDHLLPVKKPPAAGCGWRPAFRPVIDGGDFLQAQKNMVKINFRSHTGNVRTVDAELGSTVMENAVREAVPGILAECGGACACATCHVYVDDDWKEQVGDPSPMEEDMLDFAFDVRPNSRLSCQIKVVEALDGLTVTVPERQA
jgi:2Fe-2S ferredoxin